MVQAGDGDCLGPPYRLSYRGRVWSWTLADAACRPPQAPRKAPPLSCLPPVGFRLQALRGASQRLPEIGCESRRISWREASGRAPWACPLREIRITGFLCLWEPPSYRGFPDAEKAACQRQKKILR